MWQEYTASTSTTTEGWYTSSTTATTNTMTYTVRFSVGTQVSTPPTDPFEQQASIKSSLDRSRDLLIENLDDVQREQFERESQFIVNGKKNQYRIIVKPSYNVAQLDEHGLPKLDCCLVSELPVPLYDQMLAQKLILDNDEDFFLAKANKRKHI